MCQARRSSPVTRHGRSERFPPTRSCDMRVLITAMQVAQRTGAELYAMEVAEALTRRGHDVAVHAVLAGPLAEHLQRCGIRVSRRLPRRPWRPDVVHAQGS